MLGCTTEFNKWEGLTYDPASKMVYTSLTAITGPMEDNADKGLPNVKNDVGEGVYGALAKCATADASKAPG